MTRNTRADRAAKPSELRSELSDTLRGAAETGAAQSIGIEIRREWFVSDATELLPTVTGAPENAPQAQAVLAEDDRHIAQNRRFPYYIMRALGPSRPRRVLFLFHGLNEKQWDKYLPWAYSLCRGAGTEVVLFPIAFHMDRADPSWSTPSRMHEVAEERRRLFGREAVSFANAALSTRLQAAPQRFLLSGLQSYFDVVRLSHEILGGRHRLLAEPERIDFFGYSIGALLTQVLLMENPGGLYADSRAVLFCGGATLDGMNPRSRYIMDRVAAERLERYFLEEFETELGDGALFPWFAERLPSLAQVFSSMLRFGRHAEIRRRYLAPLASRLHAITLTQDRVAPPHAVRSTLEEAAASAVPPFPQSSPRSGARELVCELDFPFSYSHENPFPAPRVDEEACREAMRAVFDRACQFLA
jgi:hypothetical protein